MPVINQQTGDTLSEQSCLSPHTDNMQCLRQLYITCASTFIPSTIYSCIATTVIKDTETACIVISYEIKESNTT